MYRLCGLFLLGSNGLVGLVLNGLTHLALEHEIDIMKEASIGFDAVFRVIVVGEVLHAPFESCEGVVTFDSMRLNASLMHECTIVLAGLRPCFGNMVGIEFVVAGMVSRRANNDALMVLTSLADEIHRATDRFDAHYGREIAHTLGRGSAGEPSEAAIHAAS